MAEAALNAFVTMFAVIDPVSLAPLFVALTAGMGQAMVLGVTLAVLGIVLLAFLVAGPLERLLGRLGVLVVTRLLGMLFAALSVQFVLDGLADSGFAPA